MIDKPSCSGPGERVHELKTANKKQLTLDALEKLFNLSLDMLCVADFDGNFRIVNAAFEKTLGHSREALLRTPFIEFVHPEDRSTTLAAMEQLASGKSVHYFENRYRCRDGSYKWLAWASVSVVDERFEYAVARDITEQKATQKELATQRDLFNNVLSNVPASIFWKDRNSVFLGANKRFAQDTGLQSPEELVGKTDYDLAWTKEQSDFYRECDRKVMDTGQPMLNIEESQQQANGKKVELLTNKVPLVDSSGQVSGMLGIYMDITKLKQTESTLRKSEARLQTLFDSAAEFIFVIDPHGQIIKANRYVSEHSGYDANELLGRNIKEFFTAESMHICDCNFPILRESGYTRSDIEFVCKDGRVIDMECSATAVPDDNGNFTTFLIIQRDVTERKRAATALANSERRFRAIFNSTYQLIGVLAPDGLLLEANQTALDFGGLVKEDVVGRPFWDSYWWRYSATVQNRLKAAIRTAARGTPVRYEEDVLGKGDAIRTIDFTLKPIMNDQNEVILIISEGRDISDRKQAEEERQRHQQELAHVSRLSTMGEMASGMAHELNQPLTALVSYCATAMSLSKSLPTLPQQLHDVIELATQQAHRAGDIIRHLRDFVTKEDDHKHPIDLGQLIKGLNVLLTWELKDANVTLKYCLDTSGHKVNVNKVQIEQVLLNLVKNSIEAIESMKPSDGIVIVKTRLVNEDFIEVTVTDNGPGLNIGMADKVFFPFQTTKTTGMGMGLSISRTIVEAHGGNLWVDKNYQNGASLGFKLPVFK